MTALAGYWAFGNVGEPLGRCERMLRGQRVYAPDPPAAWSGGDIALGRRLFHTLPEDRYDRGPVTGGGAISLPGKTLLIDGSALRAGEQL